MFRLGCIEGIDRAIRRRIFLLLLRLDRILGRLYLGRYLSYFRFKIKIYVANLFKKIENFYFLISLIYFWFSCDLRSNRTLILIIIIFLGIIST